MQLDFDGLLPHQPAGVEFLATRDNAMLAWDMRTCKTSTAIRAWECTARGPMLVLCPATARLNWAREIKRFAQYPDVPPNVQILFKRDDAIDPLADVVITNYDKLDDANMIGKLRSRRWDVLVNDEAKYLKTPTAKRTQAVFGGGRKNQPPLIGSCNRVWELEGTPMPNHPAELWTHCRYLWPESIMYRGRPMELWEFELRYCVLSQSQHGMKVVGGKNLDELRERLKPYVHRLKYQQAFGAASLPRIDTWPLDMQTTQGYRYPDLPDLVALLSQRFGSLSEIDRFDGETLDAYLACINSEHDAVASLRRETGTLKAVAVSLLVRHELENGGGKTIIFAWHHDAIETLLKGLKAFNPAAVHGAIPPGKRDAEVDRFHNDPSCKVFIGQIATAGQAIDLSCSNNIVFAEQSWVPGENAQASLRASGPRQRGGAVSVRYTYLPGSIDENVVRALTRKSIAISSMFG